MTFVCRLDIIPFVGRVRCARLTVAEWCNGSTYDSDSYCLGSNPSSAAIHASMVKRLRRRPLTAETGVRFPMEVPQPRGMLAIQRGSMYQQRFLGRPIKSNSATCASNLVFTERKRRKNNSSSQDRARKSGWDSEGIPSRLWRLNLTIPKDLANSPREDFSEPKHLLPTHQKITVF